MLSRRQREGGYVGVHGGCHLRSVKQRWFIGQPYAVMAWALVSSRETHTLPDRMLRSCSRRFFLRWRGVLPVTASLRRR